MKLFRGLIVAVFALPCAAPALRAQTAADTSAIRSAAMDYIEGWYAGDAERMTRALHPELAKRIVRTDSASKRSQLQQMSAMSLVAGTRSGGGKQTPVAEQKKDFRLLDIYRGAAMARVDASEWVDYLQLARFNGRWVIVNVLWELTPPSPPASR